MTRGEAMRQNKSNNCIGNLKKPSSELGISDTLMDVVKFLKCHGECSNFHLVVDDFHHESKIYIWLYQSHDCAINYIQLLNTTHIDLDQTTTELE